MEVFHRNCENQLKRCQISEVGPCPKSSLENLDLAPQRLEVPVRNGPVFDHQIVHGAEIKSIVLAVGHLAYSAVSSTAIKFAPVLSTSCGHSNEQQILLHNDYTNMSNTTNKAGEEATDRVMQTWNPVLSVFNWLISIKCACQIACTFQQELAKSRMKSILKTGSFSVAQLNSKGDKHPEVSVLLKAGFSCDGR